MTPDVDAIRAALAAAQAAQAVPNSRSRNFLLANAPVWLAQCLDEIERLTAEHKFEPCITEINELRAECERLRKLYADLVGSEWFAGIDVRAWRACAGQLFNALEYGLQINEALAVAESLKAREPGDGPEAL